MSTFNGKPAEIQRLSIDRFDGDNLLSTCFMLSHCHTDHMEGIRDPRFISRLSESPDVFLYCSGITAAILKHSGLYSVVHKIVVLPIDGSTIVRVPAARGGDSTICDDEIAVTMIPAGHCPGSVMFLLEADCGNILYTGDFRLNTGDVSKLKALHNGDGGVKDIATIYLDTTFISMSAKSRTSFPSRAESGAEVCRLIRDWIKRGEEYVVNIKTSANYGSEYLFVTIAKELNTRVHVSRKLFNVYRQIPDIAHAVTLDPSTRLHACKPQDRECSRLRDYNLKIRKITPSALYWQNIKPETGHISMTQGYRDSKCRVAYSCHSSHEEIQHMVEYLKPSKIEPCVVPRASTRADVVKVCNMFRSGYKSTGRILIDEETVTFSTNHERAACSVKRFNTESSDDDSEDSKTSSPPRSQYASYERETLTALPNGNELKRESSVAQVKSESWEDDSPISSPIESSRVIKRQLSEDDLPIESPIQSSHVVKRQVSEDDSPIASPERPSTGRSVLPRRTSNQDHGVPRSLFSTGNSRTANSLSTLENNAPFKELCENGSRNGPLNEERILDSRSMDVDQLLKKFKSH